MTKYDLTEKERRIDRKIDRERERERERERMEQKCGQLKHLPYAKQ